MNPFVIWLMQSNSFVSLLFKFLFVLCNWLAVGFRILLWFCIEMNRNFNWKTTVFWKLIKILSQITFMVSVAYIFTLCSCSVFMIKWTAVGLLGQWWTGMNVCYDKTNAVLYFCISDEPLSLKCATNSPNPACCKERNHCHCVNRKEQLCVTFFCVKTIKKMFFLFKKSTGSTSVSAFTTVCSVCKWVVNKNSWRYMFLQNVKWTL